MAVQWRDIAALFERDLADRCVREVTPIMLRRLKHYVAGRQQPEVALAGFVLDLLTSVAPPERDVGELAFRNATMDVLRSAMGADVILKREAGVQGRGTRVDIHAQIQQHDFLITIKKGLSQQQLKTVIGEITELRMAWHPTVVGARTCCILYVFGMSDGKDVEALLTSFASFADASNAEHGDRFLVLSAFPLGKLPSRRARR